MLFLTLFTLFLQLTNSQEQSESMDPLQTTFTFMTSQNKKITLQRPDNYLQKSNIRMHSTSSQKMSKEGWYYVHFLDNFHKSESSLFQKLKIKARNKIIKDTYAFYLIDSELELISNISLIKQVLPEEKYTETLDKLSKAEQFQVVTKKNALINSDSKFYSIERQDSKYSYIINVERGNLSDTQFLKKKKRAINELSQLRAVRMISTFTKPTFSNAITVGYTQQNQPFDKIATNKNNGVRYLDRYVNNKYLTGSNQIITILDTPIDFYHAMFRDDKVAVELNKPLKDHRKFVYYGSHLKSIDDWVQNLVENEHGTIMASIAAGKSSCSDDSYGTSLYNGHAYDSKILYAGNPNYVSSKQLGDLMNTYSSYISSNSWGIDDYNNQYNFDFGNLAKSNPQSLFVFAAGNSFATKGNFSIGDPGSSKNVLTVGSIGSFYEDRPTYKITCLDTGDSIDLQALLDADPWVSGTFGQAASYDITAVDGTNGKCNLINNGHVTIVYAFNAGSINWINGCQITSSTGILYSNNPTGLIDLMHKGERFVLTDSTQINTTGKINHANFSSAGPGSKGIMKPDVVTPGSRIISAKSKHQGSKNHGCPKDEGSGNFTIAHGTSTSAANTAGASALVRQYFQSGSWSDKIDVDGSTLRALIINSCKHPTGSKSPDVLYGHGVIDLSTILPFDSSFGVQITKKASVIENKHVTAQISVTPNGKPLQITLSYLDTMLDPDSPIPITRDLDLVVVSPSKQLFKGDHLSNGDTQHFSTNEKIIIDNPEKGTYYIHVIGGEFVDSDTSKGSQDFAVVASGPVQNGYINFEEPKTCPCANCDSSNPLKCACSGTQIGEVCQAEVAETRFTRKQVMIGPHQVARVRFTSAEKITSVIVNNYQGSPSSVWLSVKCSAYLGTNKVNGKIGEKIATGFNSNEVCVSIFNNYFDGGEFVAEIRTGGGGDSGGDSSGGDDTDVPVISSGEDGPSGPDDDGAGGSKPKGKNKAGIICGVIFGLLAAVAIGVGIFILIRRKNSDKKSLVRESIL